LEFGQRVRGINAFTHSDFDVVVEVVRFAVLADVELVSNGLAVDCVEQRVHGTGCRLVKTEVFGGHCVR
jgi:hypothetical protein